MLLHVPCPACGEALVPGAGGCLRCGVPLTGPLALRLWEVDRSIAALQGERADLLNRLRASTPPPVTGPDPRAVPADVRGATSRHTWTGQQVLLGAGALLLVTAAIVFLAVAWDVLGVAGQVSVMGAATVVSGVISFRVAKRGLLATAEVLAVLTVALAVVDLAAAYQLDLAGVQELDPAGYVAVVAALLALTCLGLSFLDRSFRTYPMATVVAAALVPMAALMATDPGQVVWAAVSFAAAGLFGVTELAVRGRLRSVRVLLVLATSGYLVLSWGAAVLEVYAQPLLDTGLAAAGIALVAAAVSALVARLGSGFAAVGLRAPLAAGALLTAAATLVGVADHAAPVALVGLVAAAAAVSGFLAFSPRSWRTHPVGVLVALAQLVAAGGVLDLGIRELDGVASHWVPLAVALVAVALAATIMANRRPSVRPLSAAYAATCATIAGGVVASPHGNGPVAGTLVAVAVLTAVVAGWRRGRPEEVLLAAVSGLGVLTATLVGAESGAVALAGVLGTAGVAALAYAILPGRGLVALVGIAGCSAATWTLLFDADVTTVEAYSLPLAALAAVVGLVRLRRQPDAPSWVTVGPALTVALLPSALVTIDDANLERVLYVLLLGAAVLVGGVLLRWQSPLLIGAVALGIVAVSQLGPYAVGLPRWLSFGAVGLGLLILGARYERRRRNARTAVRWVAALR